MVRVSGSYSSGRVAYRHDLRLDRDRLPGNVTKYLVSSDVVIEDHLTQPDGHVLSPEQYVNNLMQPVIDDYNRRQKRADRKIDTPYCTYHRDKLKTDIVHEAVLQIGEHDTTGKAFFALSGKPRRRIKREYEKAYRRMIGEIEAKYPHIRVLYAVMHADEEHGTPHVHVAYIGLGDGFKRGLPQRVSLSRALSEDGIERVKGRSEGKEGFQLTRWYKDIRESVIEPEITDPSKSRWISTLLDDEVELKPYIGGSHVDSRLMRHQKELADAEIARQTAEQQSRLTVLQHRRSELEQQICDDQSKLAELADKYDRTQDDLAQSKAELTKVSASLDDALGRTERASAAVKRDEAYFHALEDAKATSEGSDTITADELRAIRESARDSLGGRKKLTLSSWQLDKLMDAASRGITAQPVDVALQHMREASERHRLTEAQYERYQRVISSEAYKQASEQLSRESSLDDVIARAENRQHSRSSERTAPTRDDDLDR